MTATLLVPGSANLAEAWAREGETSGIATADFIPNDGGFADAFRLPTLTDAEREAIGAAAGALLLNVERPLQEIAESLAGLVAKLGEAGALAVRFEESKLGFPIAKWVELVGSGDPWALYRAAVVVLSGDEDALESCGMHVFGLPDAMVVADQREANVLLAAFNVFQIVDDPVLRSGETFAPDTETPRRVLQRGPDGRYRSGHPCHNPFGIWELGPPGGVARRLTATELVFTPSLAAILMAAEKKNGAPLSRSEVEAIRDGAVCMAMDPRHARDLERSRGYADLEPELAYEQWRVLRTT